MMTTLSFSPDTPISVKEQAVDVPISHIYFNNCKCKGTSSRRSDLSHILYLAMGSLHTPRCAFWFVICGYLIFLSSLPLGSAAKIASKTTASISTLHSKSDRRTDSKDDSVQTFLNDLANLSSFQGSWPLLTPTHSKRDSSFAKAWTNQDWERHQAPSLRRYTRHLLSWYKSPTASAVLPTVVAVVIWSYLVILLVRKVPMFSEFLGKSSFSFATASMAASISLLLALKTNRALDRLLDARTQFGIIKCATQSLSGLAATYVSPISQQKALLMGRYLSLYGWCLKAMLRGEDDALVCRAMLPPSELEWLAKNSSMIDTPTCILFRLRGIVASLTSTHKLSHAASHAMEHTLSEIEKACFSCKRILASPIPPTFTRHTSRILCLYLGMLPMASSSTSVVAILLNVAITTYVFVGIDEIAVVLEHPFPLLPMSILCSTIQSGAGNQFVLMDQVPSF
jgi:putative membrane protein